MNKKIKIEASLACANFRNLEKDIRLIEAAGIDFLHVDIMDGSFVPNFALDFGIMELVREMTSIPMECHLMIEKPERYIERTALAGAQYISFHFEATSHVQRTLKMIRDCGVKAGIAFNPATPLDNLKYILDDIDMITIMTVNPGFAGQALIPATIRKIQETQDILDAMGYPAIEIQVDGNVSFGNIPRMVDAGATMLVGGTSSIFSKGRSIMDATRSMHEIISNCQKESECLINN